MSVIRTVLQSLARTNGAALAFGGNTLLPNATGSWVHSAEEGFVRGFYKYFLFLGSLVIPAGACPACVAADAVDPPVLYSQVKTALLQEGWVETIKPPKHPGLAVRELWEGGVRRRRLKQAKLQFTHVVLFRMDQDKGKPAKAVIYPYYPPGQDWKFIDAKGKATVLGLTRQPILLGKSAHERAGSEPAGILEVSYDPDSKHANRYIYVQQMVELKEDGRTVERWYLGLDYDIAKFSRDGMAKSSKKAGEQEKATTLRRAKPGN